MGLLFDYNGCWHEDGSLREKGIIGIIFIGCSCYLGYLCCRLMAYTFSVSLSV
jgi:hypothetical protein